MKKNIKLFLKSVGYSFMLVYKSNKVLVIVYLLLNLFTATFPLLSALVLKYLLDILTADSPDMTAVMLCIAAYIGALVALQALNSLKSLCYESVFTKARYKYDLLLLNKLKNLPISFIDSSSGKNLITDVQFSKVAAVHLTDNIIRIITHIYTFSVAISILLAFSVWFSLLFIVLTIPGIILNVVFDRKTEELRFKTAPDVRKFCYYRWILTDAWPAKDVRMYDLTEPIKERYDTEKDEYRKANKRLDQKKVGASMLTELIMRSGEIFFTIFVVLRALSGEVTIGNVALYIGFALTVFNSFRTMLDILVFAYIRTIKKMKRVFDFMNIECPDECGGEHSLKNFESLTFDNVYFKYPTTDKYVLSGVSFTLNRGDKLSIVGINGSGKSTIIKLMLGLYQIESGQILINGYPMSDYDIKDVRRLFSALFQSFVQYPLTLRDNIALSDYGRSKNDAEITEALKQSGVYDELQPKLENGIDSYMTRSFDDKGTELSKGQWQKLALSRTYFKNAPIVIFDEPSAALDAEAEDRIFKNFKTVSDNKTGIMISHRISAARMSNKIIVLDDGKIIESGTHDELITLDGLYAQFYNLQKEKYTVKEAE